MTPSKRIIDCGRHAGCGLRLPPIRAGAVLVHVAGRVGGPVAGEDGGAHLDLRRPPGDRRSSGPASALDGFAQGNADAIQLGARRLFKSPLNQRAKLEPVFEAGREGS
jgi:hypothetical protein